MTRYSGVTVANDPLQWVMTATDPLQWVMTVTDPLQWEIQPNSGDTEDPDTVHGYPPWYAPSLPHPLPGYHPPPPRTPLSLCTPVPLSLAAVPLTKMSKFAKTVRNGCLE